MILTATPADGSQIRAITARAGVFNADEVQSLGEIFDEYLAHGSEDSGYYFIVDKAGDQVLGYACYGPRDYALAPGVFDLYWIAVDPDARQKGVGRGLSAACETAAREMGGRMLIAETSGTPHYASTRQFYLGTGYQLEAGIKDFYAVGDDLNIFVKRL